ncbi:MAG TPA: FAD-binding protein [Gammaproteobacteria bacterium]|nr:FAD-binding protein [Gammaproteobacteria bacterium]
MSVTIIGGGWAGLACAVELCQGGMPVTVFEAAPRLGGRARRVTVEGDVLDNGQHLLIGGYRETLRLMTVIGVAENTVLHRQALQWDMRAAEGPNLLLGAPRLPAPFHLAWALATAKGWSWPERRAALGLCTRLLVRRFSLDEELPVKDWLARESQPARVVQLLWSPLCLATLNTPIENASTQVFLRVLRDSFARRRADSDLLLPAQDLSALFPEPAAAYINSHGGKVLTGTRVSALTLDQQGIAGLTTQAGTHKTRHIVLAAPPLAAARLLSPHSATRTLAEGLNRFQYEPITTVYVRYPPDTRLTSGMVGFDGRLTQWLFDLGTAGKRGWMAAVISGSGPHMALSKKDLEAKITDELARLFPHWPAPQTVHAIREKRATFSCHSGVKALRPGQVTAVKGLYLAGDYTATGYPATLEGAVISGVRCARAVRSETE